VPAADEGAILAHLESESVALAWVQGERLLLSRSVPLETIAAGPLAVELRRTLLAGAMAGGEGPGNPSPVDAIWLTGEGAHEHLAHALAAALGVGGAEDLSSHPVASSPRRPVARCGVLPRGALPGGEELTPALDTALGLALLGLRPATQRLDLARQAHLATQATTPGPARRVPLLAGVGAMAVVAAVLLLALPSAGERELAAAASRAQRDAREMAALLRRSEDRARLLQGAVTPAHSYLDVLNDVSATAGGEVWLTQFTYDRGRPIVIRGAALSNDAVARLVEGLRRSRHLEQVALGPVTRSEAKEKSFVQFTITGLVRGDAPLAARRRQRSGA
jgi:Tfp pilus assembly protein PilN